MTRLTILLGIGILFHTGGIVQAQSPSNDDSRVSKQADQIRELQTEIAKLKSQMVSSEQKQSQSLYNILEFPDVISKLGEGSSKQRYCKLKMQVLIDPEDSEYATKKLSQQKEMIRFEIQMLFTKETTKSLRDNIRQSGFRGLRRDIQRIMAERIGTACTVKISELQIQ